MTEPPRASVERVAFDRVADRYDETRGLSPEAERAVAELLEPELAVRKPCLEIGVGTGRIALPLARAGVPIVGMDLSVPMLARLRGKAGGRRIPLVLGDATALPFAEAAFGSGLVAHVLHLIPDWRGALTELLRVVRPGGVLLVLQGGRTSLLGDVEDRFRQEAALEDAFPGLDHDVALLDREMASRGAAARSLPTVIERRTVSLSWFIDQMEQAAYSWTWWIDEPTRHRAASAVRRWAAATLGDLDDQREIKSTIDWRAYDLE
jgi:SAM-dependent methyltransferase